MSYYDDRNTEKLKDIKDAIMQASEFMKKAELAHLALTSKEEGFSHSKSFAAAKRSSMDLTRALAKMRGTAA